MKSIAFLGAIRGITFRTFVFLPIIALATLHQLYIKIRFIKNVINGDIFSPNSLRLFSTLGS